MRRTLRPEAALATTDTGSSGSPRNAALDEAVKFAQRMRDSRVEEFPRSRSTP